jgi:hypothetical protein
MDVHDPTFPSVSTVMTVQVPVDMSLVAYFRCPGEASQEEIGGLPSVSGTPVCGMQSGPVIYSRKNPEAGIATGKNTGIRE